MSIDPDGIMRESSLGLEFEKGYRQGMEDTEARSKITESPITDRFGLVILGPERCIEVYHRAGILDGALAGYAIHRSGRWDAWVSQTIRTMTFGGSFPTRDQALAAVVQPGRRTSY